MIKEDVSGLIVLKCTYRCYIVTNPLVLLYSSVKGLTGTWAVLDSARACMQGEACVCANKMIEE